MYAVFATLPEQSHLRLSKRPIDRCGLIMRRDPATGKPSVNIPRVVVRHDATGFNFGDHKNQSRELALNALHHCMKSAGYKGPLARDNGEAFFLAHQQHTAFGQRFIYGAPDRGLVVPWSDLLVWLKERGLARKRGQQ